MVRYLFYTIGDLTYQSPLALANINTDRRAAVLRTLQQRPLEGLNKTQ